MLLLFCSNKWPKYFFSKEYDNSIENHWKDKLLNVCHLLWPKLNFWLCLLRNILKLYMRFLIWIALLNLKGYIFHFTFWKCHEFIKLLTLEQFPFSCCWVAGAGCQILNHQQNMALCWCHTIRREITNIVFSTNRFYKTVANQTEGDEYDTSYLNNDTGKEE